MTTRVRPDPITFELIKNALAAIADEMAVTIVRTARSFVMKEAMDFSTAICNAEGEMVAQGLCLPLHMGSIPAAMEALLSRYRGQFAPGDIYALNDPYEGGSHLPDIFVIKPMFTENRLAGFSCCIGHQTDIGGRVAGGNACDSTEIYQEGLRIPPVKLYERGVPNDTLFRLLEKNVRVPATVLGDVMAEVAACRSGEREFLKLVERYGLDALQVSMHELLDYTEELTRAELRALPDGVFEFADYIDDDGITSDPITIQVAILKQGDSLTADFTGTSPQCKGAINAPLSWTKSCVYACIRSILDASIPNNAGYFRPLRVIAPAGSFANCVLPAPVAARGLAGMRIPEAIFGALAKMLPHKIFACEVAGDTGITIAGYHKDRSPFVFLEFLYGSWGGSPTHDGIDACASLAINYSNTPAELIEVEQPIMIEQYGYVPNSGGPGKFRGGLALVRDYRFLAEEAYVQVRCDRYKFLPYGLSGGKDGTPANNVLNPGAEQRQLPSKFLLNVRKGDVFRTILAGPGGWGDPLERDPQLVCEDVRNEKLTADYARREYGVVLNAQAWTVDLGATEACRDMLRRERDQQRLEKAPLPPVSAD
ncbi:MAG: hydantoinase B/oxoprolinase family protein [Nitrospinae bacterium]|nr:hydantoinase B/oxoprolinase family protein [Nitrospinota bacterium]